MTRAFGGIRRDIAATQWEDGQGRLLLEDARSMRLYIHGENRRRLGMEKKTNVGGIQMGHIRTNMGERFAVFLTSAGALETVSL